MRIRAEEQSEQAAVEQLTAAAFGDEGPTVVAVLRALRETAALRASLVALEDVELVGHVALSRGWVDTRERLVEVLVLSPLSVAPARQRSGIGTALLAAAREEAARLGSPAVFLEGDGGYYGSRGFAPAEAHGFSRPSDRIPGPAFQVALTAAYEETMTGRLVYPEAFWSTDAVGLRDPLLSEIERLAAGPDGAAAGR